MVEIHSEVLPSPLANLRISLHDPDDHAIAIFMRRIYSAERG